MINLKKILTLIRNKEGKYLLLHNNYEDITHGGDIWYVVTGAVEEYDKSLKDAVIREVNEETNLNVLKTYNLNTVLRYVNHGNECEEYVFLSEVDNSQIKLNEEWVGYEWLEKTDFINKCFWYGEKVELINIMKGCD